MNHNTVTNTTTTHRDDDKNQVLSTDHPPPPPPPTATATTTTSTSTERSPLLTTPNPPAAVTTTSSKNQDEVYIDPSSDFSNDNDNNNNNNSRRRNHHQHSDSACSAILFPPSSLDLIEEMTTFEPVPDEFLMKEMEEYQQQEQQQQQNFEVEDTENDPPPHHDRVNVDEQHHRNIEEPFSDEYYDPQQQQEEDDRQSQHANNDHDDDDNDPQEMMMTYPEVQVIESHYTSSPEKLNVISLAVLVFYNVSGGPFGIETTVRAGGNFYALLGFLVMPFVWSLQEALMTAELGTTFVEASGGVAWVEEAFGPAAGWISGYLGWIAGATDNAIYPVLFCDYVTAALIGSASGSGTNATDGTTDVDGSTHALNPMVRFVLLSTTSILLAYINWRGLPMVGKMSVAICLISMSPFVILIVVGAFKVDPKRWLIRPIADTQEIVDGMDDDITGGFFPNAVVGGILWRPYLNNLFWNLNSFDAAGTLVAELDNLQLFFRAMMLGVFLVVIFYFLPLLIAIGATDSEQTDWTNGYLAAVNSEVVGPWLGVWTIVAAAVSNIALFQAELSSDAFQLMGMADRGHLPKIFSKRSQHGTPTYGIILGTVVIVLMGVSDLDTLIEMLNFNYAVSLLLEYAAFFKLRVSRPDLERPYRIPLNTCGCALFFLPSITFTLIVMSLATYTTFAFAFASYITGLAVYLAKQRSDWLKPMTYELVDSASSPSIETEVDDVPGVLS